MIGLSRGTAVLGLVWIVGSTLAACGGDSVDPSDGEAGAAGVVNETGGAGGTGGVGGTGPSATGGTAGSGARGGTNATGGFGVGGTGGSATGGSTSAGTGGTRADTGGTGSGAASGGGGEGGAVTTDACGAVRDEYAAELARIQACTSPGECGKELLGTSCGCTRNLVARLDADTTRLEELIDTSIDGETCVELSSPCDCPEADGYACNAGRCAWNYVDDAPSRTCNAAPIGRMCVSGVPSEAGESLAVGDPLQLAFHPYGCFSSSCSELEQPTCRIQRVSDNSYMADATLQVCTPDDDGPCTSDCSGPEPKLCNPSHGLVLGEGAHEVTMRGAFGLSVTFDVPSTIPAGGLCVEVPAPPEQ